eukprot:scaffold77346_cov60-Phaeocystis_antarctica.AAC.2
MQASGAKFDMVMSTKEQETFETALSARDGFKAIKEELSQVDVRQVREHTALAALQGPGCDCTGPEVCTSLRLAGGVPQHQGQERHLARAGGGRGLRRVQQSRHRLDA